MDEYTSHYPPGCNWRGFTLFFTVVVGCFGILTQPAIAAEKISDVRVVIDVSGSMKQNDPKNLRAPALRMLVGMMPKNTRSGVWTFGKFVNAQVPVGQASDSWKTLARREAGKIHSRGLFTDIESALLKSTRDWKTPDRNVRRHLVLLTDGYVDISKNANDNEASRKRILHGILPQLKAAGVTVHTIGLSKNADSKLMSSLAGFTDGWHETVETADQLNRVFLRIFEKTAPVDTVPLLDNKFTIDKSIKDMTVLAFRKDADKPTELVSPSGKRWTAKSHPKQVSWFSDTGYDLISSKDPEVGEWALRAAVDPDNRVMVITNLKLSTSNFPNNILYGDKLTISARLLQDNRTVTQEKLLSLVRFNAYQNAKALGAQSETPMFDDGKLDDKLAKDGVYTVTFTSNQLRGDIELTIQAKGPTFKRETKHSLKVHDTPADVKIEQDGSGTFVVQVKPRMSLLIPESVSMQITLPEGQKVTLQQKDEDTWQTELDKSLAGKVVKIAVAGTRVNDKPFEVAFERALDAKAGEKPLEMDTEEEVKPVGLPPEPEPAAIEPPEIEKPGAEPAPEVNKKDEHADKKGNKDDDSFNWTQVIILIAVVNGVLIIGGGAGYFFWRKRKKKREAKEQEELGL